MVNTDFDKAIKSKPFRLKIEIMRKLIAWGEQEGLNDLNLIILTLYERGKGKAE